MLPTRLGKGSRIGAWEIVSPLGQGGMGTVFVARDAMGRTVALKVLLPGMLPDATARRRFEREAEAAARLAHPNVARVHSAGEAQGTPYLVLELATKGSLGRAMKERGKFPWREAALLGVGIARGLEAIHAAGFVHRDLKPDNVLLDDEGRPRVTDFGLVSSLDPSGRSLTQTGELLGTPAYMAPEQANAKDKVDFRADLYSLGATLHALLTGGPPFDGSGVAVLQKVLMERPPGARRAAPDVPRDFEAFILELLEKEPGRRPSSAGQVALELESIARTGRRTTRRGRRLVLGLPALAVVAAAVIFFSRARQGGEPSLPSVAVIPSSNDTKFLEGEAVAALAMNAIDLARGHAERAVSIAPKDAFALGLLAEARRALTAPTRRSRRRTARSRSTRRSPRPSPRRVSSSPSRRSGKTPSSSRGELSSARRRAVPSRPPSTPSRISTGADRTRSPGRATRSMRRGRRPPTSRSFRSRGPCSRSAPGGRRCTPRWRARPKSSLASIPTAPGAGSCAGASSPTPCRP